jgi:hypothetical protein
MNTSRLALIIAALAVVGCSVPGADDHEEVASSETDSLKQRSGYNCNPDHRVDVPAQITSAVAESSRRVHLHATAPTDASGYTVIDSYVFADAAGHSVSVHPQTSNICPLANIDNPLDFSVEALAAGTTYSVTAISRDSCGNTASSASVSVITPADSAETNPPTVSAAQNVRLTVFIASEPGVAVYAKDDTAIEHVEFIVNGVSVGYAAYNDVSMATQSITAPHGFSDARGEGFYQLLPASTWGTTATIEVKAYDVFGNVSDTTSQLSVPAQ